MKKIALGSDHAGFELKEHIKQFLKKYPNFKVIDVGCFSPEPTDYPAQAQQVAALLQKKKADFGILCCGTGIGMAIAANKQKGIRAANAYDITSARLAREHNNANVLTLGGRLLGREKSEEIVEVFLNTRFARGRHQKRVAMLEPC